MKTKAALSVILLAGVSLLALSIYSDAEPVGPSEIIQSEGESRAYLHSYNLPAHGVALDGYCPVAYFAVNKPVKGQAKYASTHKGVTYWFVNADAKDAFDVDPEKYIPAYGGWCAFGMAVEDKFPVDPTNFKISNGRLLLFLKNKNVDALELWNKGNEKKLFKKADAHWKKVQG